MPPTKKRSGVLFPGHNYLGPGNPIDDAQPVDEDDRIAREHDIAYARARTREDVETADNEAIDQFAESGNLHGVVGALGLEVKKTWENVFGQTYPAMAPPKKGKSHAGHESYRKTVGGVSKAYKEHKKGEDKPLTWNEFIKKYWKHHWQQQAGSTTQNPRESVEGRAGTSGTQVGRPPKRVAEDEPGDQGSEKRYHIDPEEFLSDWIGADPGSDNFDTAMSNMDVESMEAVANPSTGASMPAGGIKATGKSGSAAGGKSGRGGGSGIVGIPRTPKTEYYTKSYRKSWVFFSYGYTHKVLQGDTNNWFTTPLALVPVDLLSFYMDQCEFDLLHGRVVAVESRANVRPLGCRMNFQVNSTTSGWATSEFVAIGQSSIGLNLAMPIINRQYTPNGTKPMEVDSSTYLDMAKLDEKLYGGQQNTGQGMAQMVPRHLNMYATLITPTNDNASAAAGKYSNPYGPPKLDQYVDRFLVNTSVGVPIVEYNYKFKNGIIFDQYSSFTYNTIAQRKPQFITSSEGTQVITTPNLVDNRTAQGEVKENTSINIANAWKNVFEAQQYQTIENYLTYKWTEGQIHDNMQPQIHVGLTAVPAINPANDSVDFQNTSIYWAVETELVVHHYQNSAFHYGNYFTYAPNFYQAGTNGVDSKKTYHGGLAYNHHPDLQDYNLVTATDDGALPLPTPMDTDMREHGPIIRRPRVNKTFSVW
uniref:Capsid protein n=1 Tax=Motacilla cinerea parvoviridae sp. TaxID=2794518 RepID=A0A8A4XCL7_9VIRU|nr:MAG: capsid protein [Motacilla cinerea parvoviridae sp.]